MNISRDILYKLLRKRPSLRDIAAILLRRFNYAMGASGSAFPPLRLFINLNNRCNAKCRQCDVGTADKESLFYKTMIQDGAHEMDIRRLEILFAEAGRFAPVIAFNGVEPTLYKDLPRAIAAAKRYGCRTQVTTNGILLPKVGEALFAAGLDTLWVSLDGPPGLHDQIRGVPGSFNKALEGLKLLHEMKKDASRGPSLNVVMTILHLNQDAVYGLMGLLRESGIALDEVMIQHLQFITKKQADGHNAAYPDYAVTPISADGTDPALIDPQRLMKEVRRVEERRFGLNIRWKPYLKTEDELRTYYRHPERFWGDDKCRVFWNELQILADGSVTGSQRCYALPALGNINGSGLHEIWDGKKMREWRIFLKGRGALPACSRCCSIF